MPLGAQWCSEMCRVAAYASSGGLAMRRLLNVELAIRHSMAQKRNVGNSPFNASLGRVRLRPRSRCFEWRNANSTISDICFGRLIPNSMIRLHTHTHTHTHGVSTDLRFQVPARAGDFLFTQNYSLKSRELKRQYLEDTWSPQNTSGSGPSATRPCALPPSLL